MRFVNRNNVCKRASALFLLPIAGTKEKAKQKENAVKGISPPAGGDRRLRALDVRRLLEKAGENFQNRRMVVVLPAFPPTSAPGEVFTLR